MGKEHDLAIDPSDLAMMQQLLNAEITGAQVAPLTAEDVREMSIEDLYQRLSQPTIGNTTLATGSDMEQWQNNTRTIMRREYVDKISRALAQRSMFSMKKTWTHAELEKLSIDALYTMYCEHRDSQMHNPMEF
jgi:hypothetical protein